MRITLEAIRAAGGIVHSDGNIFFRDISMPQGIAGAAPAAVAPQGEWRIDTSAGREILVYKNCSVIEDADARYVLSLIAAASQPAAAAAPTLDVTLDEDQAGLLRDMLGDREAYPEAIPVRLLAGDGHSGHGLYVAQAEYQDEGAVLLASLPAPAAPALEAPAAPARIVADALIRLDAIYREEADCDEPPQRPDWLVNALHLAAAAPQAPAAPREFQQRVHPWLMECFGPAISADKQERNHRFLEEALETVQAAGCTASEAHQLVDYVFGRPVGELGQEVGGAMTTLAALCLANGIDMHAEAEKELARVWTMVEKIRAKQAAKPKHSPLPAAPAAPAVDGETTQEIACTDATQRAAQSAAGSGATTTDARATRCTPEHSAAAVQVARDAGFNHGVCLALQIMASAGNAGDAEWTELLNCAGREEIMHYARHVETESWLLCGFAAIAAQAAAKGSAS